VERHLGPDSEIAPTFRLSPWAASLPAKGLTLVRRPTPRLAILPRKSALTELSVGSPSRHQIDELPAPLRHASQSLRKLPSAEILPWLAQQAVWHWGGTLRRPDLTALAAYARLPAEAAFALLNVAGQLHGNWHTAMPPEATLHRKSKRREQALLARPVVRVRGTPGLLHTIRQRLPSAAPTSSVEIA